MNFLRIGLILATFAGCSGSSAAPGASGNSPGISLERRANVLMLRGRILDVRVAGEASPFTIQNIGVTANGLAWPVVVNGQIIGLNQSASPSTVAVGLVSSHSRPEMGTTAFDATMFYGINALAVGARYVVVAVTPVITAAPGALINPQRVFRVDANGRLAEPAFEFPAGTPVSTVMDPSTLPRELVGDPDASAPPVPADASAGGG